MNNEAPSWADQWGTGGIGAMDDHDKTNHDDSTAKPDSKNGGGLFSKIKNTSVKWFKPKSTKKTTSSDTTTSATSAA
ncbi:hypothetical protein LINPERPRIM_LOCUS33897 [Linum perenne]